MSTHTYVREVRGKDGEVVGEGGTQTRGERGMKWVNRRSEG